jgi:hypothetical protein
MRTTPLAEIFRKRRPGSDAMSPLPSEVSIVLRVLFGEEYEGDLFARRLEGILRGSEESSH